MSTLEWIGQDKVVNHHLEVPYRVLEEQYTYNSEQSENMIIRGDNRETLKALPPRYKKLAKDVCISYSGIQAMHIPQPNKQVNL